MSLHNVILFVTVGVLANLTIWVYNLNYTQRLANPLSVEFQTLAQPFCQDVSNICNNNINVIHVIIILM